MTLSLDSDSIIGLVIRMISDFDQIGFPVRKMASYGNILLLAINLNKTDY